MLELFDTDFKIAIIKCLNSNYGHTFKKWKIESLIKKTENLSKQTEDIKKTPMEILEVKINITKIKNLNRWVQEKNEETEKMLRELEH